LESERASRRPVSLQWSAADKVAPGADLGGDALLLGQLLAHALGEKNGSLGLHEQRHAKVNGVPPHDVVLVKQAVGPELGKVEASADVVLLEHLTESTLVLLGEGNNVNLEARDVLLEESLDVLVGSKELVAERLDVLGDLDQGSGVERALSDITTERRPSPGWGRRKFICDWAEAQ